MKLEFTVPAVPVGQPRARATVGHNGRARMHEAVTLKQADGTRKPHPILAFKATVKHAAAAVYSGAPLDCPLSLEALFVFPRPQSMRWKNKPMPREWHSKKPDCDNFIHGPLDGLTTRNVAVTNTTGLALYEFQNRGKPWRYVYQAQDYESELAAGQPLRLWFVQCVYAGGKA